MTIRQTIRDLTLMIRAAFNWEVVEFTTMKEVQHNKLTGAYRWRFVNLEGDEEYNGPWIEGAPQPMVHRALIEQETTLADLAQMLAPDENTVVRLDYGTEDLTGYAVRLPSGKVIAWRECEEVPDEVRARMIDPTPVQL